MKKQAPSKWYRAGSICIGIAVLFIIYELVVLFGDSGPVALVSIVLMGFISLSYCMYSLRSHGSEQTDHLKKWWSDRDVLAPPFMSRSQRIVGCGLCTLVLTSFLIFVYNNSDQKTWLSISILCLYGYCCFLYVTLQRWIVLSKGKAIFNNYLLLIMHVMVTLSPPLVFMATLSMQLFSSSRQSYSGGPGAGLWSSTLSWPELCMLMSVLCAIPGFILALTHVHFVDQNRTNSSIQGVLKPMYTYCITAVYPLLVVCVIVYLNLFL